MFLVQKAKETDNPRGLPPEWPVKANPCNHDDECPMGWEKMSKANLDALKEEHQQAYDEWKASQEAEQKQREESEKTDEEKPCKTARAKLKTLLFTDAEIKKIMGNNYVE